MRRIMRKLQEKRAGLVSADKIQRTLRERLDALRIVVEMMRREFRFLIRGNIAIFISRVAIALIVAQVLRKNVRAQIPFSVMRRPISHRLEHFGKGQARMPQRFIFAPEPFIALPRRRLPELYAPSRGTTNRRRRITTAETHPAFR